MARRSSCPTRAAIKRRYPQPEFAEERLRLSGHAHYWRCSHSIAELIVKIVVDSLHHHELRLFHRMWEHLDKGDIVLGDRAYGEYTTAAALPQRGGSGRPPSPEAQG